MTYGLYTLEGSTFKEAKKISLLKPLLPWDGNRSKTIFKLFLSVTLKKMTILSQKVRKGKPSIIQANHTCL